ncbi:MAG TPA: cupin domain-containing protein [Gaiellaceae bacterium]|nr:cupin domain-containing protein [Gaiellaceae bacterium]
MSDVPETSLVRTKHGLVPDGDGWFVLNARDAVWEENDIEGAGVGFENPDHRFPDLGIGILVLQPGQPNCMYHGEADQEDFLVLDGECLLLVEGEERLLRRWDFVHSPPWAEHVFVGAGGGPCWILAVGGRRGKGVVYPRSELALRHCAGVEEETRDAKEAYADVPPWRRRAYRDGDLPDYSARR